MDDRRFDSLVRSLAGKAPRRAVLRALAGGAGAALIGAARRGTPSASAHHGALGPGDACYDSDQCVAADAPLACGDNGFDYDGPLNCCTFVGSRCGFDEACCGTASCIGGVCTNDSPFFVCSGAGCDCDPNTPNACDAGLVCCGGAFATGVCQTLFDCTGLFANGETCPAFCQPGPNPCPTCASGYCNAAGICG